jgi:hypothetical protein
MFFLVFRSFKILLKFVIYLAITGEIYTTSLDMRQKAHRSVTNGLMSIKALNQELHK